MRILVTGANGQVGHELLRALAPEKHIPFDHPSQVKGKEKHPLRNEGGRAAARGNEYVGNESHPPRSPFLRKGEEMRIIPATRSGQCISPLPPGEGLGVRVRACETLDLADLDELPHALDRIAPDLILNAAAYTAVDRAEGEPELAQRINGDALGVLGAWARQHGARVLHYSTDYVFDGSATRPYREDDSTHPVSVYGRSKLAGEIALRESGARHLILRTAWVYAARGKNFLLTMLRLGAERDTLRVVDDQIGAPTSARLIAETTAHIVAQWCTPPSEGRGGATANARAARMRSIGGMPPLDGTYHLVASGQTSWCGFARAIFERTAIPLDPPSYGRGRPSTPFGTKGVAPQIVAITTADYPTKAARPAYSVLDTAKLRQTFGIDLPDWQAAFDDVIDELACC